MTAPLPGPGSVMFSGSAPLTPSAGGMGSPPLGSIPLGSPALGSAAPASATFGSVTISPYPTHVELLDDAKLMVHWEVVNPNDSTKKLYLSIIVSADTLDQTSKRNIKGKGLVKVDAALKFDDKQAKELHNKFIETWSKMSDLAKAMHLGSKDSKISLIKLHQAGEVETEGETSFAVLERLKGEMGKLDVSVKDIKGNARKQILLNAINGLTKGLFGAIGDIEREFKDKEREVGFFARIFTKKALKSDLEADKQKRIKEAVGAAVDFSEISSDFTKYRKEVEGQRAVLEHGLITHLEEVRKFVADLRSDIEALKSTSGGSAVGEKIAEKEAQIKKFQAGALETVKDGLNALNQDSALALVNARFMEACLQHLKTGSAPSLEEHELALLANHKHEVQQALANLLGFDLKLPKPSSPPLSSTEDFTAPEPAVSSLSTTSSASAALPPPSAFAELLRKSKADLQKFDKGGFLSRIRFGQGRRREELKFAIMQAIGNKLIKIGEDRAYYSINEKLSKACEAYMEFSEKELKAKLEEILVFDETECKLLVLKKDYQEIFWALDFPMPPAPKETKEKAAMLAELTPTELASGWLAAASLATAPPPVLPPMHAAVQEMVKQFASLLTAISLSETDAKRKSATAVIEAAKESDQQFTTGLEAIKLALQEKAPSHGPAIEAIHADFLKIVDAFRNSKFSDLESVQVNIFEAKLFSSSKDEAFEDIQDFYYNAWLVMKEKAGLSPPT